MKTLFASLLIAMTANAFAGPIINPNEPASFQSSVYVSAASDIRVAVDKATNHVVEVRLLDEKGHVVARKTIAKKQSAYRARFDVNGLPDGHYQMEITDGISVETRKIDLATSMPTPSSNRVVAVQ